MTASTRKKSAGKKKTAVNTVQPGSAKPQGRETSKDKKTSGEAKLFQGAQLYPGLDKPAVRPFAGARPSAGMSRPAGVKASADAKERPADGKPSADGKEKTGAKPGAASKKSADAKKTGDPKRAADRKKRPAKRKRKNKLALFATVFCMVMTVGGVFLALASVGKARENTDSGSAEGGGTEEITAEITQTPPEPEGDDFAGETQDAAAESRYGALLADAERMERERIYAAQTVSSEIGRASCRERV